VTLFALSYLQVLSDPVNIVMEYMSHGNLIHYMRHAGRTLTAVDQLYIAKQVFFMVVTYFSIFLHHLMQILFFNSLALKLLC